MDIFFFGIVTFLIVLALFDLVVGVSNDAVNFLNSAIGARVARFRTIVAIAAIGVFVGASMSNGMMDVARHGIMTPLHYSFYDVMCVLLAVMVTDVVLLDVFNTLGMPTSTTVSMVFELLGGAFAIALIKIAAGAVDEAGRLLSLGDLLNTEKALSVILGIFLSVAIAFVVGTVVQWVARLVFTFTYRVNGKTTDANGYMGGLASSSVKIGVFSGLAATGIIWFLLVNGLKSSTLMTAELRAAVNDNVLIIVGGCAVVLSAVMSLLSAFRVPVLKFVVLLGTFALAMAFAGNDLVNFIGVPLTGLEALQDYNANGAGYAEGYMMRSLMGSAATPPLYLMAAGAVMVLALIFSKKAQNVVKTSVDLSSRDEGDEMFGASAAARVIVRSATRAGTRIAAIVPPAARRWIDSRFNADEALSENGAAFDHIRAAVNLVVAGLLVAIGTSMKLPLSTTYVTFMVAMGASLADRAWSRESAVFRITGVLSVIGGWFITAGAAFIVCYLLTNAMYFGHFAAMIIAVVVAISLIVRSNIAYSRKKSEANECDIIFSQMAHEADERRRWTLLLAHVRAGGRQHLDFVASTYRDVTDAFMREDYRRMKRAAQEIEEERKSLKRHRRREIAALRRINPITALERNTWYFMTTNAVEQMLYCAKRINDPCLEHTANNFRPISGDHKAALISYRDSILALYERGKRYLDNGTADDAATLRTDAMSIHAALSAYRRNILDDMQKTQFNIEMMTIHLVLVQESQEMLSSLRHLVRGMARLRE